MTKPKHYLFLLGRLQYGDDSKSFEISNTGLEFCFNATYYEGKEGMMAVSLL